MYSTLIQIKNSLGLKSGSNTLIKSIGCPKTREHPIGVKISYVPNPTPPAASLGLLDGRRPVLGQGSLGQA